MKLIAQIPIASRRGPAFVTRARGCSMEEVLIPSYDVSNDARAFRRRRRELDLNLGEAARKLGLKASEVSGLEHGRFRPADGWAALLEALG